MRIIDGSISKYIKNIIQKEKGLQIVSKAENLDMLLDYVDLDEPDLIIISKDLDSNPQGENLLKKVREIRKNRPLLDILILVDKYNKRFFQKLVNLGIYSIIIYDDIEAELIKEIKNPSSEFDFQRYEQESEKREYINKVTKGFKRVIAIYSAGTTGKSFVSSNLAYTVAGQRIKTALIDGDLENRALSYYFYNPDETKQNAIKELIENQNLSYLDDLQYRLLNDNLRILTNKKYNEGFEKIFIKRDKGKFMAIIDYLRSENEVVFIDTNKNLDDEITKNVLNLADTILLVQDLDYKSMEENKIVLKKMESMNIPLKKIVLVINKYLENKEFTPKKIEKYFNHKFAGITTIPQDTEIAIKNIRYGKPAVALKGCSEEMIESFYDLSRFCYGIEKFEKKGGVLSKILGV
ncbi:AAA family ATPase [Clostridiisalibacter paucivorans]|uniref:nucleotide-binding protein n=1 Tax=Clostridiisalibacter paucivorans TaxID=408753 RepID=UPI00047DD31B|nr:AAA family ATPase [Clostridiisalibacter paucivorans]